MLNIFLFFAVVCSFLAFLYPRLGLWLMLVVGLLADPVRKLTPDQPLYINLAFLVIFAVIYLTQRKRLPKEQRLLSLFPGIRLPFQLFLIFLAINAIRPVLVNIAYLKLVLFSAVQYLGLFLAAQFGYNLVKDEKTIIKFSDVFIITMLPFLFSVVLTFMGFDEIYPVLRVMHTMGEGQRYLLQKSDIGAVAMLSGLFRNPEGMGLFAMVVSVICCYLLARKKCNLQRLVYYLGVLILSMFCVLVSARRKYLLGVFLFILIFIILSMRKNFNKGLVYLFLFMAVSGAFFYYAGKIENVQIYLDQGESSVEDVQERLNQGMSVIGVIRRYGLFGRGLGFATQGAAHLGTVERGVPETGPAKVVTELGVPGFLSFLMILLAYIWGVYKRVIKGRFKDATEVTGVFLLSLVITHLTIIVISHQTYADPLVAITTGFTAGFLLAYPRIKQENIVFSGQELPKNV